MQEATVSISGAGVVAPQRLSITIEVDADVQVSAVEAQRNATVWLLDEVDAATGQVLASPDMAERLIQNGQAF